MPYYLLRVNQPGSLAYKAVADARHHIQAHSIEEAEGAADQIIDNHYGRIDKAVMELFDQTGLVAVRRGEGEWDASRP